MLNTYTRCGRTFNADEFGNYVAGFQGAAYDRKYHPHALAKSLVEEAGLFFHLIGNTKAKDDPYDDTGFPLIHAGEADGGSFNENGGKCGCSK